MDLLLEKRTAWVVGASSVLGAAIATTLSRHGMRVWLTGRSAERLESLRDRLRAEGAIAEAACVTHDGSYQEIIATMISQGTGPDLLVNSTAAARFEVFDRLSDQDWSDIFEAKLMTYVRSMRAALPYMETQGSGCIVNISGKGGRQPSSSHLAGGAMNAAVNLLTKGISDAWRAKGVCANVVSPGPISSPRLDDLNTAAGAAAAAVSGAAQPGQPDDVANAVAFLASPRSAHINGIVLAVDGGSIAAI